MRRARHPRRVIAAVAALSVAVLGVLPAEHVHGGSPEPDPHHDVVIHRHYDAHHHEAVSTIEHSQDDHEVRWLAPAFTARDRRVPVAPRDVALGAVVLQLRSPGQSVVFSAVDTSVHDPPGNPPSGLRGPPSFSA